MKNKKKKAQNSGFTLKEEESHSHPGFTAQELEAISPPLLHEKIPDAKVNDYYLEIGDNLFGARYMKSWFMKFHGRTTWVGMFDSIILSDGDAAVDMTVTISPQEIDLVMARLALRLAILNSELSSENNPAKRGDILQEISDLEGKMGRLRVNAEKTYNVSSVLSVSADAPEKLRKIARTIIKRMSSVGVRFHSADTRQLETWRHAIGLSGGDIDKDKQREMESSNAADFFLFGYGGLSHRRGVLLGFDHLNRPVFYDGWDARLLNQHMVVFGQSGSGKSYAVKILTRRSSLLGIVTGIVDPEEEYKLLIQSMDGAYADLSPNSPHFAQINIYDVEEDIDDAGNQFVNIDESCKAVRALIFKMVRTIDPHLLTGRVKVAIYNTVKELYQNFGITSDPDSLFTFNGQQLVRKDMPILSDHYELMLRHPDLQNDIAPVIKMFTRHDSPEKAIFDGPSTFSLKKGKAFGISLKNLEEEWMKPIGTFIATKWVWEKFAKKDKLIKKRLIIDESQFCMEEEEEAKWLENSYRRGRKLNVSMCAITQGFEVFLRVPQGMGILKNAPTKVLLRQEKMDIEAVAGKFDLAEGEARFLLNADQGVGILKVDNESTIIRFKATEKEDVLYSTKPGESYVA